MKLQQSESYLSEIRLDLTGEKKKGGGGSKKHQQQKQQIQKGVKKVDKNVLVQEKVEIGWK